MKLVTQAVVPGDWIIIEKGAPDSSDLSPQYVRLNGKEYPGFIDNDDLIVRCPPATGRSTVEVVFNGRTLGRVEVIKL